MGDDKLFTVKFHTRRLMDKVDVLHSYYTTFGLLYLTCILFGLQFLAPIQCITPKEVDDVTGWSDYVRGFCFVTGTYRFQPGNFETQTLSPDDRIDYYQWAPVFLFIQAILFFIPHLLWLCVQTCFYIDLQGLFEGSEIKDKKDDEEKKKDGEEEKKDGDDDKKKEKKDPVMKINYTHLAEYIFSYFYYRRIPKKGFFSWFWHGRFIICFFYFTLKVVNLANVVIQFFLACHFLRIDPYWGFHELLMFSPGYVRHHNESNNLALNSETSHLTNFTMSPLFPIVVRCDYTTSILDFHYPIHNHPTQCMLTLNYLNEKVYLFIYFWYIMLALVTFINIFIYCWDWLTRCHQNDIMARVIENERCPITRLKLEPHARRFANFLGPDGALIFNFMSFHGSTKLYHATIIKVWNLFREKNGLFDPDLWSEGSGDDGYTAFPFGAGDATDSSNKI